MNTFGKPKICTAQFIMEEYVNSAGPVGYWSLGDTRTLPCWYRFIGFTIVLLPPQNFVIYVLCIYPEKEEEKIETLINLDKIIKKSHPQILILYIVFFLLLQFFWIKTHFLRRNEGSESWDCNARIRISFFSGSNDKKNTNHPVNIYEENRMEMKRTDT